MATLKDVLVPDIGDFADVPVVELLVAVGDVVALDAPLVAVESDKATMEIPAPFAGRIESLGVAVGDTVSEGTKVAVVAVEDGAEAGPAPEQATPPATEAAAASSVATAVVAEAQAEPEEQPPAAPSAGEAPSGGASTALGVHASPIVRRLARELSLIHI